jgi:hypothetical protein
MRHPENGRPEERSRIISGRNGGRAARKSNNVMESIIQEFPDIDHL